MAYRQIFLDDKGQIKPEHWQLLSDKQLCKFVLWSLQTGKPVLDLLQDARFMVQEESDSVLLEGTLPYGNLYGCLCADGSTHT
jgi:hypothetical protein